MGRMKIGFVIYRDWALQIVENLLVILKPIQCLIGLEVFIINTNDELNLIDLEEVDLLFFIGWSSFVPKKIHNKLLCIGLHPSSLPKYRGGSPIQNQIIEGVLNSSLSFYIMSASVDEGNVITQVPFSLEGNLHEIFNRIVELSPSIIFKIILEYFFTGRIDAAKQDESKATYCYRRKPEMSEIKIDDFSNYTALDLHNKIRALQEPYPNAFVKCKDGTKLYLTESKI